MATSGPGEGENENGPAAPVSSTQAEFYRSLANEALQPAAVRELVPSIAEQLARGQLTGTFTYDPNTEANMQHNPKHPEATVEMQESEGVHQLQAFLHGFIESVQGGDEADQRLAAQAADLLENLTYISSPELEHGSAAIAADWKGYLDQSPEASLYLWAQQRKSSQFLLDKTLGNFSDHELEQHRGRLHFVQELGGYVPPGQDRPQLPPEHKVVMFDDWTASGRQAS